MYSIRALLCVTLFVACMTALGQLGIASDWHGQLPIALLAATLLNLIAFGSILQWIHEIEQIRRDQQRYVVLFADATAFVMFACQLIMTGYVLGLGV